jgi:hypothetical protein
MGVPRFPQKTPRSPYRPLFTCVPFPFLPLTLLREHQRPTGRHCCAVFPPRPSANAAGTHNFANPPRRCELALPGMLVSTHVPPQPFMNEADRQGCLGQVVWGTRTAVGHKHATNARAAAGWGRRLRRLGCQQRAVSCAGEIPGRTAARRAHGRRVCPHAAARGHHLFAPSQPRLQTRCLDGRSTHADQQGQGPMRSSSSSSCSSSSVDGSSRIDRGALPVRLGTGTPGRAPPRARRRMSPAAEPTDRARPFAIELSTCYRHRVSRKHPGLERAATQISDPTSSGT